MDITIATSYRKELRRVLLSYMYLVETITLIFRQQPSILLSLILLRAIILYSIYPHRESSSTKNANRTKMQIEQIHSEWELIPQLFVWKYSQNVIITIFAHMRPYFFRAILSSLARGQLSRSQKRVNLCAGICSNN